MTRRKRLLGRKSELGEAIFLSVGVKMVINVFTRVFFLSSSSLCCTRGGTHWSLDLSVESLHLEICHFVEKGLLKGNNIFLRATSRGNDRAWVFNVMESTRS